MRDNISVSFRGPAFSIGPRNLSERSLARRARDDQAPFFVVPLMQRHTGKGSSSRSSCGDVLRGTQQAGMSVLRLLSVPLHPCASAVDVFSFRFCFSFVFDPLPSARSSAEDRADRNVCITIFLLF